MFSEREKFNAKYQFMILYLLNLAVGAKETYQNFKETSISYWSTLSKVHSQCKIYFTIETNKTKTTNFVPTKHMALYIIPLNNQ